MVVLSAVHSQTFLLWHDSGVSRVDRAAHRLAGAGNVTMCCVDTEACCEAGVRRKLEAELFHWRKAELWVNVLGMFVLGACVYATVRRFCAFPISLIDMHVCAHAHTQNKHKRMQGYVRTWKCSRF